MSNVNPFLFARSRSSTNVASRPSGATLVETSKVLPPGHSQSSTLNLPNGGFARDVQLVD